MKSSSRHIRQAILTRLYTHLKEHYSISLSEEFSPDRRISLHQLDGILAFKTDDHLDALRSALERLEEGTFGLCLSCKNRIEDDLTDEDPTRRVCRHCEQEYSHTLIRSESFSLSV